MNIENKYPVTIYKNENKYTVGIGVKKKDGTYDNAYFPIQFNQGVEVEHKTKIYIKNAWLSFYKWEYEGKKGTTFFIKCSDFETVDEVIKENFEPIKEEPVEDPYAAFGNSVTVEQLDEMPDLPF